MTNAPESCGTCGYLERRTRNGAPFDRCLHTIPFQSSCGWHRTPAQIRAMHERDVEMMRQVNQPMQRRGL